MNVFRTAFLGNGMRMYRLPNSTLACAVSDIGTVYAISNSEPKLEFLFVIGLFLEFWP